MRVVSLFPAATDMLLALGQSEQLLGHFHASSDSDALNTVAIDVDFDLLRSLEPDLILIQGLSSTSSEPLERELQVRDEFHAKVLSLNAHDLGSIWQNILLLASALGVAELGDHLVFRLQQAMASIAFQTWGNPKRVLYLECLEPLMTTGLWMPELSEMAGVEDVLGLTGQPSRVLDWSELESADPDAVIIMPRGCHLSETQSVYKTLAVKPEWRMLRAVKTGQIFGVNAAAYFLQPGPTLVASLQIMAEIFHSESFDFGHKNKLWCCLETL